MTEEEIKLTEEEETVFEQACKEIADFCIKFKNLLEEQDRKNVEQDRKNAEERKRIEHRKYYLECKTCGSKDIRRSRAIKKREGETWDDVEDYEYYNHDGFGWELDSFELTCVKCGGDKIEVAYENIEESKSR